MHCDHLTLEQAAALAQLDPHDVACSCEEHGRCETDDYIITPANDGKHFIVRRR